MWPTRVYKKKPVNDTSRVRKTYSRSSPCTLTNASMATRGCSRRSAPMARSYALRSGSPTAYFYGVKRFGGSLLASVLLHAAILVWVAARWTRWRDAFERPEPQPIEVEAVAEPAPAAAPAGGHGGGGGATVARAPRSRPRTRTVTVEPMGTEPIADVPGPPAAEPG